MRGDVFRGPKGFRTLIQRGDLTLNLLSAHDFDSLASSIEQAYGPGHYAFRCDLIEDEAEMR